MSQSDKTSVDQETLRAATTPELHALLKKTFDTSGGSEYERTLCLRIAEELERRGEGANVDADAAWARFSETMLDRTETPPEAARRPARRRLRSAAALAAMLAVVLLGAGCLHARANGTTMWARFAGWTRETFSFGTRAQSAEPDFPAQLEELEAYLQACAAPLDSMLPRNLPEGYAAESTLCDVREDATVYLCQLTNGQDSILMEYRTLADGNDGGIYEKNDAPPEEYATAQRTYFVFENVDLLTAVWSVEDFECAIMNVVSHDELIKMLDSIAG
ncbi:MAG: DUF4367 domain-containing protein [Oscillospiraceae bacterium]|nr:DUF4367 domain-containing protein [Oscillospiraceae bacterium]